MPNTSPVASPGAPFLQTTPSGTTLSDATPATSPPAGRITPATMSACVRRIEPVADGVISIALEPADADVIFPPFTAGAHIDLHLPNGITRSYSLHNAQSDTGCYKVGVLRDRASRGGSSWLHSHLQVGDVLPISRPRNNFALVERAARSVFVSGGIGITPLLSMIHRLRQLGGEAHLLYCARSRKEAPFLQDLTAMTGDGLTMQCHFSAETGAVANMADFLSRYTPDDHFYCCGPSSMLDGFEVACDALGFPNVHVERFKAATHSTAEPEPSGQCVVELAQSGRTVTVPKDRPLLRCLIEAEVEVEYSCEEGVCGACETRILSGEADHRDSVLSKSQKASHSAMMPCVSRCKSDRLVLDL